MQSIKPSIQHCNIFCKSDASWILCYYSFLNSASTSSCSASVFIIEAWEVQQRRRIKLQHCCRGARVHEFRRASFGRFILLRQRFGLKSSTLYVAKVYLKSCSRIVYTGLVIYTQPLNKFQAEDYTFTMLRRWCWFLSSTIFVRKYQRLNCSCCQTSMWSSLNQGWGSRL